MQYCLDDINAKINFINFFNGMLINKINSKYLRGTFFLSVIDMHLIYTD